MNEINEKVKATIDALNKADEENTVKDPKKRRDIVKNVLIVFLALMLGLTFFSNTIMNKSLAQIYTESTSSGRLTERVRGSGIVEANQTYDVTLDGNRTVDSIMVRKGQSVAEGDVLFTVGTGESAELAEAKTTLDAMKLDYQKLLLTAVPDYAAENQAIKNAREDYNNAVAKRDAAVAAEKTNQAALDKYNSDKISLESYTEKQVRLTDAVSAVDSDMYSGAPVEYIGSLPTLCSAVSQAQSAYDSAYALYSQSVSDGGNASALKADADAKQYALDSARSVYSGEKTAIRNSLVNQLGEVNSRIGELNASIAAYESKNTDSGISLAELNNDVTEKQRALESLIIALDETKKTDSVAAQINNLDIEAKNAEIEKQQSKVDALAAKCEITEITAKFGGVVNAVNIRPDDITVPDTPLVSIDIDSAGYTVNVTVDGNAAASVEAGASAEVVNNWSDNVTAVLREIRSDTSGNSKNRVLVFDLTGDVDSGTYVDLSIPCGSSNYDVIVPKSAVYEDSKGKFVLTVKSKSSPLGNRYFAERVNVSVLASDETSSAVSGGIESGAYVITAASKPVVPGDQVRMKDD